MLAGVVGQQPRFQCLLAYMYHLFEISRKLFFLYDIFPPINLFNEVCMNIFICIGTSNVCVKWKRELVIWFYRALGYNARILNYILSPELALINGKNKSAVEAKSLVRCSALTRETLSVVFSARLRETRSSWAIYTIVPNTYFKHNIHVL